VPESKDQLEFTRQISDCLQFVDQAVQRAGVGPEDEDDLRQDILFHLWLAYPSFRAEAKFTTWLSRISGFIVGRSQKQARQQPVLEFMTEDKLASAAVANQDIDPHLDLLHAAIRKLPEKQQTLIQLFLQDKKYREIAGLTGLSESNVSNHIQRAKAALVAIIEKMREDEDGMG